MQNHKKTLIQILLICGSVFAQGPVGQKIDGVLPWLETGLF